MWDLSANTVYARTELREMIGATTADNWGFYGTHILTTSQKVTQIPSNGNVVTSQIHAIYPDGSNGPALIKVQFEGNDDRILVMFKSSTASGAADVKLYVDDIKVGQLFDTEIKLVDGYGYVTITTTDDNGNLRVEERSYDFLGTDPEWANMYNNYFKAGNYVQDSIKDDPDTPEGAEVRMYSLTTYHSDEVEDVKIESLDFVRTEITLGLGDTTTLSPVFAPIDTYNKNLTFEVISGGENVAVTKDGTLVASQLGEATILATSQSDPSVTKTCTIKVVEQVEQEVEKVASWDFNTHWDDLSDLSVVLNSDTGLSAEIVTEDGNNILKVVDDNLGGTVTMTAMFPEQTDTTTFSYKIRVDDVRVKDAGTNKPLSSVIYMDITDEITNASGFRIRSTGDYNSETEGLDNLRWQVSNNYSDVTLNTDEALINIGEWFEITVVTTPDNGTGYANTSDVYINGLKVADKITDNNPKGLLDRVRLYSGTKDLVDFSLDYFTVYAGEKLPDNISYDDATSVSIVDAAHIIGLGDSLQLQSAVAPATANQDVTYSTTSDVVAVSNTGLVVGVKVGTATIRATSVANPSLYTEYEITVTDSPIAAPVEEVVEVSVAQGFEVELGDDVLLLDEQANWDRLDGAIVENPFASGDKVLKVEAGETSTSNIYKFDAPIVGDTITVNYKVYAQDNANLEGGIKLYHEGDEVVRMKVKDNRARYVTNSANTSDDIVTLTSNITANTWHDITLIYSVDGGEMVTDVYLNGVQINDEPLANWGNPVLDGQISLDSINFFSDSKREGTFYYNNINVQSGAMEVQVVEPEVQVIVKGETPKPELPSDMPSLPTPVAYPETNIYGSGLNGHEIIAPQAPQGNTINVTDYTKNIAEGEDVTDAVRAALADAQYGDTVYFPNGTYNFITEDASILTLKDGVSLQGESQEGTILKVTNTGSQSSVYFMRGLGVSDFSIKDMTLTSAYYGEYPDTANKDHLSNNRDRDGNMTHGIYLDYNSANGAACQRIEIENVTVLSKIISK